MTGDKSLAGEGGWGLGGKGGIRVRIQSVWFGASSD